MAGHAGDQYSRDSVLAALCMLLPDQFTRLTRSLAADSLIRLRRLSSLLLSPARFRRVLCRIESLHLRSKTLLLARLLLRSLRLLTLPPSSATASHLSDVAATDPDEFDAGLLLLALCRVSAFGGAEALSSRPDWREALEDHVAAEALRLSGLGDAGYVAVTACIDEAMDCRRFIEAVGAWKGACPTSAPAAQEAVASLAAGGGGRECMICREEVRADTCELPCSHVFHLACVRRWLMRVNTCPICRFELPTDDVFFEIERLWRVITARSRSTHLWGGDQGSDGSAKGLPGFGRN